MTTTNDEADATKLDDEAIPICHANHVRNICKTCFIQIRDLRRVRKHLTDEAAILAANALVSSRLDYCNSLQESVQSQYA